MSAALVLIAALAQSVQSGPVLTLDEALAIAEQNAFSVRISDALVQKARARQAEIRGLLGPKVTTSASYLRNDKEIREAEGGGGGGSFVVQPIDQKQAGVQISMPFDITGTLGRGVQGASSAVRAAEASLAAERNTLRLTVRSAYYGVLRADALVVVAEQTLTSAQQRLENEKRREEAGDSARVDVLRFETQFAQARSDVITARNAQILAKEALNNTLGRPIETPFSAAAPTELPKLAIDENVLARAAVARRPEVESIRRQREALGWVRRAQEGGLLPSLNLSANFNRNLDAQGQSRDYTAFGTVALSWPIFDSGVTRSRVKQARQDEEIARVQQEQIELGISLEVRQASANLLNAASRLEVAVDQERFAAETYRLAQVLLDAGEGTSLEVTDAQTELTRARTALANARYDYLTAFAQLQRAVAADDPASAAAEEQGKQTK